MKIISHRGNLNGPERGKENTLTQIHRCIEYGFDVEIDIRMINNQLYLGHDIAKEIVRIETLKKLSDHLWIHCKNIDVLEYFIRNYRSKQLNYFWHENDKYTITSKGFIWCYPGSKLTLNSIKVMPEWSVKKKDLKSLYKEEIYGICTDYPILIK